MSSGDRYAVEAQDPRSEPMSHVPRPNPAKSPTFQEGEQVGGRYEVIERIGEGNYAVTYRGRDTTLGRAVALKILRSQYASDPTFVSRFEREARVAASVFHPNIVDVYDYGAHDDTFFIAMQYVAGEDLKHALQARGRFSAAEAVQVARQILRGLGAIHSAGIIHRDIKPQNILVGRDGVVRVTDFGIAHHAVETALTSHGTTVGTASYMAPEQARGGALSEATDLYAVGVVLFELLTGRLPFEAANPMAVMLAHLQKPAPTPSDVVPDADVPAAIEAVVMRALQKAPGERYQTAAEMMRDLDASSGTGQGSTAALAAFDMEDPGATTHLPAVAAEAGAGGATQSLGAPTAPRFARPAMPQSPSETPAAVPNLPPRRRRRDLGWLGPLIFFGVALATLGGVLAANLGGVGDGSTGGRDRGTGVPAVVAASPTNTASILDLGPLPTSTPTPTLPPPTTAPTATVRPSVTPSPTARPPTNTPIPSPTATATPRPAPTSTPRSVPTATPRPTATAKPPTPEPTPIPVDVDPPIGQASGGANSGSGNDQVIVPITEDDAVAPATGGGSQTFPASQWTGETTPVQSSMYGRPAVAVYGGQTASLTFQLDTVPAGGATLSITGLDDEYGPVEIAVDVNGQAGVTGQLFTDWSGDWNSISWSSAVIDIPAGVLREGRNTVTMRNLQQDSRQYFLIDETRVESASAAARPVSFSSASQDNSSGRASDKKGNANGSKGREKG